MRKHLSTSSVRLLISTFIVFGFFGCKQELPTVIGSIDGTIINTLTEQGEYNALVYLLDASYRADSANTTLEEVLVDSTRTNVLGQYRFDSIPIGHYSVVPISPGLKFIHDSQSDSFDVIITGNDTFQIDFSAAPSARGSFFTTNIEFINIPAGNPENRQIRILVHRREWIMWQYLDSSDSYVTEKIGDSDSYSYSKNFPYGYTTVFYTLSNAFWFGLFVEGGVYFESWFEFGTNLLDTPEVVNWVYDCATKTMTRQ